MHSIYDRVKVVTTVLPGAILGSLVATVVNGTTVDTIGLNTAMIHAYSQISTGAGTVVITLQESADNSTWANANDNTGTVIGFTLITQSVSPVYNSARIEGLGLNRKRYLRGVATFTSAAVLCSTVATIILGRSVAEPEYAGSTTASNT